ncbi:PREDICTED: uncharacterized protein LOC109232400 [Nicotiana attenuata]|uniref:UspA domain-containing protein n=1 Tax=Nicotiana attenuata TaxID=49451 RepID=A0A1J6I332_NICAT|nr:PREDICTED: uncharacterized protein LOC109232400 [Nicotiana attenuata]OIS98921.1 hypothetical protein A4A49_35830 [Nicotiana attenuata]
MARDHIMADGKNSTRKVMVVADPTRESAAALQYALSHAVAEKDTLILLHVGNPNAWRNLLGSFIKKPLPNSATSSSTSTTSLSSQSEEGRGIHNNPLGAFFKKSLASSASPPSSTPSNAAEDGGVRGCGGKGYMDFLGTMKQACEAAQPKIKVCTETVEMDGNAKEKASIILAKAASLGIDVLVIGQRRSLSNVILRPRRSVSLRGLGLDMAEYLIENSKCTCVAVQRKGQTAGYLLNTKTHRNFWLLA